jgi:hypothetical protein
MSERLLKTLRKSGDFQAEYEGLIPFARSNLLLRINPHIRNEASNAFSAWLA